jgi:hypothetical protein
MPHSVDEAMHRAKQLERKAHDAIPEFAGCIRRRIAQGGLQVRLASCNGGELLSAAFSSFKVFSSALATIVLVIGYTDAPSGSHPQVRRLNKPYDQVALARALEAVMSVDVPDVVVPLRRER